MQKIVTFNSLYEDYLAGLLEKKDFEGELFKVIRREFRLLPGLNYCDMDDFISWLYLRLGRTIDGYKDKGSSFETYINSLVHLAAKEFRYRQARSYSAEYTAWITQVPTMHTYEASPEYSVCDTGEEERLQWIQTQLRPKKRNARQLLILVLKCCNYVSHDFVEKVSPSLGLEPQELADMIDCLKKQRVKREDEIALLNEKANSQFYRCLYFEHNLKKVPDDGAASRHMKERLERGRNRLAKLREKLAKLRPDPSNLQIANILGIAKGTVDAALHNLKLHNAHFMDNNRHILN